MSRAHRAMLVASVGQSPRLVMVPKDDGGAEYARRLIASAQRSSLVASGSRATVVGRIERVRSARDERRKRLVRRPSRVTAAATPAPLSDCFRCLDYGERGWGLCPFHAAR